MNRARAFSITATGVSLGGAVLAPLGSALIDHGALRVSFVAAAVVPLARPLKQTTT